MSAGLGATCSSRARDHYSFPVGATPGSMARLTCSRQRVRRAILKRTLCIYQTLWYFICMNSDFSINLIRNGAHCLLPHRQGK